MWPLLLTACSSPTPPAPPHEPRRHVLLVVIDTLRADAVQRSNTPVLDGIASRGEIVNTAWSASTWTVPSMISMFTGMPVRQHGWNREPGNVQTFPKIPPAPMLAQVLQKKGYETSALYANDFLDPNLGFSRGFDTYRKTLDHQMADRVAANVAEWKQGERQFLYVHMLGPHSPLKPSDEARERKGLEPHWLEQHPLGFMIGAAKRNQTPGVREAYEKAYDAVVEDTDARLGEILEALGPHRDDTLIVVTSDHGELLGEHGFCGHGWWAWEELVHVPLVVEGGVPLPDRVSGTSIPAIITESLDLEFDWPTAHDATLLVTHRKDKFALSEDGVLKGIWTDEGADAYDLSRDNDELVPLPMTPGLTAARARFEAATPAGSYSEEEVRLHESTIEALESLGYLQEVEP